MMKMQKNTKLYIGICFIFFIGNLLNTYFLTTSTLNRYVVPFERSFLSEFNAVVGNLLILSLIFLVMYSVFKERKHFIRSLLIVTILINIGVFALSIFIKYYSTAFSYKDLTIFKNPGTSLGLSIFWEALKGIVTEAKILNFLPSISMAILFGFYDKKVTEPISKNMKMFQRKVICGILIVFGFIFNFGTYAKLSQNWEVNVARGTYVYQNLGVYPYYVFQLFGEDFKISLENMETEDEVKEALNDTYNKNKDSYQNVIDGKTYSNNLTSDYLGEDTDINQVLIEDTDNLTGILKDKDLVIIHLESFNMFLYERFQDQWPFLQRLLKESYVLENFYNGVGIGTSADAEFGVLTGLYPTGYSTLYWDYEKNPYQLESLAKLFKKEHYYTEAIHGDVPEFYNKKQVYPELIGFDNYYDKQSFLDDNPNVNEYYNHKNDWITDYALADYVKKQLKASSDNQFLFPATMMPHTPFAYDPYETDEKDVFSSYEWYTKVSTETKKYVHYIEYYDEVIERFLLDADGTNQIDTNTVYLFYGDHGANLKDEDIALIYNNPEMDRMEYFKHNIQTMAFLYVPGEKINPETNLNEGLIRGTQTLVRTQMDLYRTVIELFDLKTDQPYFGTHILSSEPGYAIHTRFFAVFTDTYDGTTYDSAAFLMGNQKLYLGDISNVSSEFKKYLIRKKKLLEVYVKTSMLTKFEDLKKWNT